MSQQPNPNDIKALIADSVAEALADAGFEPGQIEAALQAPVSIPDVTFKDVLTEIDPADSQAGLAMLDWLVKTDRLRRIGVLDGGQGYMFIYEEPKGSDSAGHRPGAKQGDRIVDAGIEKMQEQGAKQITAGLCPHCMSAVQDDGSGLPFLADEDAPDREKCPGNGGGPHGFIS